MTPTLLVPVIALIEWLRALLAGLRESILFMVATPDDAPVFDPGGPVYRAALGHHDG